VPELTVTPAAIALSGVAKKSTSRRPLHWSGACWSLQPIKWFSGSFQLSRGSGRRSEQISEEQLALFEAELKAQSVNVEDLSKGNDAGNLPRPQDGAETQKAGWSVFSRHTFHLDQLPSSEPYIHKPPVHGICSAPAYTPFFRRHRPEVDIADHHPCDFIDFNRAITTLNHSKQDIDDFLQRAQVSGTPSERLMKPGYSNIMTE
jgi:hypothetical protein